MKFNEKEQKNALYIAGGLAVAAIIYQMTLADGSSGYDDPTGNGYVPGTNAPPQVVFDPKKVADKLYEAMRYTGTDEVTILAVLKKVTAPQFTQVKHWFGKRSYNPYTGNQYTAPFVPLTLYPLDFWLKEELNDEEYSTLRLKYPNDL